MQAMQPITLHYSEGLLRRAVRAFWWHVTRWSYAVPLAVGGAALAVGLWRGDRSWVVGVLGTLLGCLVLISATVYVGHYRSSLGYFRRMRVPEATLELGEERFRLTSELGMSEIGWDAITGVRRYPEFWLLYFSRAQFMTLPTADLPEEARTLILARVKELKP
jgi:hypothetical protein